MIILKKENRLIIMFFFEILIIIPTFGFINTLAYVVLPPPLPSLQDTDGDGLSDYYEKKIFNTNPKGNYYFEEMDKKNFKDPYLFYQENYLKDLELKPVWDIIYQKFKDNISPKIKIGIIDCGYDINHEDWGNNIDTLHQKNYCDTAPSDPIINNNCSCEIAKAEYEQNYYHGTWCLGLIAAEHYNGKGIAGIAGLLNVAEVINYKIGTKGDNDNNFLALAIEQAVEDGCKIISMSFGTNYLLSDLEKAIKNACFEASHYDNVLLIASAGNTNMNLDDESINHYPSQFNGVLSVGAVNKYHRQLYYNDEKASNYGKNSIDLLVMSESILTTTYTDDEFSNFENKNYISDFGETSAGAAIVAGIAALLWVYFPELSLSEVKSLLTTSGPISPDQDHFGYTRVLNAVDLFTAAWDYTHSDQN